MNAICTQLQSPINSGLTQWRLMVSLIPSRITGGIPLVSTIFSLSVENERADAGRDDKTSVAMPNFQVLKGTGKNTFSLFN